MKWSAVQNIQKFIKILNLFCDPDLEHIYPIFAQDTQAYDVVLSKPSLVANGPAV